MDFMTVENRHGAQVFVEPDVETADGGQFVVVGTVGHTGVRGDGQPDPLFDVLCDGEEIRLSVGVPMRSLLVPSMTAGRSDVSCKTI